MNSLARPIVLAAAIAVSLLLLAGAGGAAQPQTPKRGGTIVIADTEACINPLVSSCFFTWEQVLEGAFEVGPGLVYRPSLVSSVDVVSKSPMTLRYHVRPEARWSDGVSLTAADFVFTRTAFVTSSTAAPVVISDFKEIRRARAIDAKTLLVVLKSKDPEWRRLFPIVLPRHALRRVSLPSIWKDSIDDPRTGKPIGSGPFLLANREPGKQLTLVRNPHYWGRRLAYVDRIVHLFLPTTGEQLDALRRGQVDVAVSGSTTDNAVVDLLRNPVPGIRVLTAAGPAWEHLEIRVASGGNPVLRNPLVRRALAYGIDREAIARQVLGDYYGLKGSLVRPLDSVVFLASSPHYKRNWADYRYQPERARALLRQAGCTLGADSMFTCSGQPLQLRFITTAGVARRQLALTLMASELRRVGIAVEPQYAPPQVLLGCVMRCILSDGDFDVVLFAWVTSSEYVPASYQLVCGFNFGGYCDRLMTRDLNRTFHIVDPRRRVRLLNAIDTRLARAVPWIPLFQVPRFVVVRANVRGIDRADVTQHPENWWLDRSSPR